MEDMKANELMIGDWVISNKRGKNEIVKVVSIEGGTNCCWLDADCFSGLVACEDLSPILLTPEILEKNGFVQEDDAYKDDIAYKCFCEILTGHYSANDVIVSYDGSKEFTITNDLGYPCDEITLYRPKVHELQHALRLCGLNELADNFKV